MPSKPALESLHGPHSIQCVKQSWTAMAAEDQDEVDSQDDWETDWARSLFQAPELPPKVVFSRSLYGNPEVAIL